jgi:hypothetical protein
MYMKRMNASGSQANTKAGHHCPRRFTPYGSADTTNVTNYNTPL